MLHIHLKDRPAFELQETTGYPLGDGLPTTVSHLEALFRMTDSQLRGVRTLDFDLPAELEAGEPPEARGLARDEVRLMVSYRANDRVVHTRFRELPDFLRPGDVLVINTSGTMNAALDATR